jgi:ABC-2 type transport system ATP-binding protein
MIKTQGLTKRFQDVVAVDRLDLDIPPGEIFGLLGPNGAGKTTMVKLLTGLLRPTAGEAWVGGFHVQRQNLQAKRVMALVPDQPYVYPLLTGKEFMRFVGDMYQVEMEYQKRKIPELLALFELDRDGDELVETYSHGMRQKLVLASVLLHRPRVLLLDEPLVGLDPKSARLVKEILERLALEGVTVFMCTHVLEIAERICRRVGILQKGRLTVVGTPEELRARANSRGTLEEAFLQLTGGSQYKDMLKYL